MFWLSNKLSQQNIVQIHSNFFFLSPSIPINRIYIQNYDPLQSGGSWVVHVSFVQINEDHKVFARIKTCKSIHNGDPQIEGLKWAPLVHITFLLFYNNST
jgi:hypothetical protein